MSGIDCDTCASSFVVLTQNIDTLIVQSGQNVRVMAVNGNFSSGNTGFSTQYTYNPNSIWNEGTYAVGTNPNAVHPNFGTWGDHTTGSGNYMIVNGSVNGNTGLWSQNVSFPPNIPVTIEWWTLTLATPPGALRLRINGTFIGGNASTPNSVGVWQRTTRTFTSSPTGNNQINLLTVFTAGAGNDFGLDDIWFSYNCQSSDTIYVAARPYPIVQMDTVETVGSCDNVCVTWTPEVAFDTTGAQYTWNFGDGSPQETGFLMSHCYTSPGWYTPSVHVVNQYGCEDSAVLDDVFVGQTPNWQDIIPQATGGYWDGTTYIVPSTNPAISVIGNFTQYLDVDSVYVNWGDGTDLISGPYSSTNSVTYQHTFTNTTNRLQVCLYAWNEGNCFDEICFDVAFTPYIEIPNVFSPNNDGINDIYLPDFSGAQSVKWTIFNRWGSVIYDSESATEGWDGTFNGRTVAEGVYFITATANGSSGQEPYLVQGTIQVYH